MAQYYRYRPLVDPDEIRVFEPHGTKQHVECLIRHVRLYNARFQALSYV